MNVVSEWANSAETGAEDIAPCGFSDESVADDALASADTALVEPTFLDSLFANGLLFSTGVDGLYGRSGVFERVVDGVSGLIGAWGTGRDVEVLRFPPAMSRDVLEQSGYWGNFPDQIGSIFSFNGNERQHRRLLECLDRQEDWTENVKPTRLSMTPVACYPVYPVMGARGAMPEGGRLIDMFSYCCRHEPSKAPERMIMFRQREFVRMGTAEQIHAFRSEWIEYAQTMMRSLQLPAHLDVANDPFFGRAGALMKDSQREQKLKYELLVPVLNSAKATAVGSFNNHLDKFSRLWNIRLSNGEIAQTGCCGFGLERIALSLFKAHGLDPAQWPTGVRQALWGETAHV